MDKAEPDDEAAARISPPVKRVLKLVLVGGKCPFDEWLKGIRDMPTRLRIVDRIDRIALGSFGDTKAVGGGVHELRLDFGPGYRIYYCKVGEVIVVLLAGGDKKSQVSDIAHAQALLTENRDGIEGRLREF